MKSLNWSGHCHLDSSCAFFHEQKKILKNVLRYGNAFSLTTSAHVMRIDF